MHNALRNYIVEFWCDESGQNITEYAAIIAFVGVLVAFAFYVTQGTLFASVSQSYSSVDQKLNNLNSYTAGT